MKPSEFKKKYWPQIAASCAVTGLNPLFVAAQAALETGWGDKAIGNNLFGIVAGDKWTGLRQIRTTTEYLPDDRQGWRFAKVHSIVPLANGKFRYTVDRAFRDYATVADCIDDHFRVLSQKRFRTALEYKDDVPRFALELAKAGYCTAPAEVYASSILKISKMIEKA